MVLKIDPRRKDMQMSVIHTKNISWNTYVISHTYLGKSAFTQCSVSDRFRFRFVNEYQVRNEVKFFMKSHLKFYRTLIFGNTLTINWLLGSHLVNYFNLCYQ